MGWRYVWYTSGALVFVLSILRLTVINLKETPKYLLGQGKDEEVVETLGSIATKYNRPFTLTVDKLAACGTVVTSSSGRKGRRINIDFREIGIHLQGLFLTKKLGYSTILIWISWTLIGLAYPLYNVFLPVSVKGCAASIASLMLSRLAEDLPCNTRCRIWRRLCFGLLAQLSLRQSVVYSRSNHSRDPMRGPLSWPTWDDGSRSDRHSCVLFCVHSSKEQCSKCRIQLRHQVIHHSCSKTQANPRASCILNIYYGCLYAYTPEVLPSAHRTTGNGVAVACNRLMGIMSAVIGKADQAVGR